MIRFITGNMFEIEADCLINTVNCEGFMGKGIAYQFKMRFPQNNKDYIRACKTGELRIGTIHSYVEADKTIINFPTKDKWRANSKIEYIEQGMEAFIKELPSLNVKKIAIPSLGCGNGGLEWNTVKQIVTEYLIPLENDYEFFIFEPSCNYQPKLQKAPELYLSSLIVMELKMHLLKATKLRLQKAAYLLNYFLKEDYFKFSKYKYGPYDYSIDIIAKKIGEFQTYYSLMTTEETFNMAYKVLCSEKIDKQLQKVKPAVEKAASYINQITEDKDVEGITTVLYLVQLGENRGRENIIRQFKEWSEDKANRFSLEDINQYIDYLENTDMIEKDLWGNYLAKL